MENNLVEVPIYISEENLKDFDLVREGVESDVELAERLFIKELKAEKEKRGFEPITISQETHNKIQRNKRLGETDQDVLMRFGNEIKREERQRREK